MLIRMTKWQKKQIRNNKILEPQNEIMRKQKLTRITRNFSDFDIHKSTPKEENYK